MIGEEETKARQGTDRCTGQRATVIAGCTSCVPQGRPNRNRTYTYQVCKHRGSILYGSRGGSWVCLIRVKVKRIVLCVLVRGLQLLADDVSRGPVGGFFFLGGGEGGRAERGGSARAETESR